MISILTTPPKTLTQKVSFFIRNPRYFMLRIRNYIFTGPSNLYGGHFAVTRSLIQGLKNQDFKFNYNPPVYLLNETCVVLSGVDTLRYAIDQKKRGKIKLLIAGPNIITVPSEVDGLITSDEVDICLVPSIWVKKKYAIIAPQLNNRLIIWQAGVDANYWYPSYSTQKNYLLYIKGAAGKELGKKYIKEFNRIGVDYKVITYGEYSLAEYKILLNESKLMIVLGGTESQGLAFAEAWAMNVPTLIYFVDTWTSYDGTIYWAQAAPCLSNATGAYFTNVAELFDLLNDIDSGKIKYSPREWVLNQMTDEVCAKLLLEKIERISEQN